MIAKNFIRRLIIFFTSLLSILWVPAQKNAYNKFDKKFSSQLTAEKPAALWYWNDGAVSKSGITADLEAMRKDGIKRAYLVPVNNAAGLSPSQPAEQQFTAAWWGMVDFAMQEAVRLQLQLSIHVRDRFALAGVAGIKPGESMQHLVWTKEYVRGGALAALQLEQPMTTGEYYKDIAVFAYPVSSEQAFSDTVQVPTVTTSTGAKANFLCFDVNDKDFFKSDTSFWLQYQYPRAFTCRSVHIHTPGNHSQPLQLALQASEDGIHFKNITQLQSPGQAGQYAEEDFTNATTPTTARFFRFVYNKVPVLHRTNETSAVKSTLSLQINTIFLSDEPAIDQYESKNGSSANVLLTSVTQQPGNDDAVPLKNIINLTDKMDSTGKLSWTAPAGNWVILRMGQTPTRQLRTADGAQHALEADRFNPVAVEMQFEKWFETVFKESDKELMQRVQKIFYIDYAGPGYQNWSISFAAEFKKRRGYDLTPYLPAMAGVPVENNEITEQFLRDIRATIAELTNDKYYSTLKKRAHKKGLQINTEPVTPALLHDSVLKYQ